MGNSPRREDFISYLSGLTSVLPPPPYLREEQYWVRLATGSGTIPEKPITRMEQLLDYYLTHGGGITVEPITVTENGTYTAPDGKAYTPLAVNVPGIEPQTYEWQQTSAQVQAFLDYMTIHPYDPDDYTTSYFDTHTVDFSGNPERPKGQAVNTDAGVLEVGGYKKTVTSGSNTIYNTVPNVSTPYALNADGEVKQTGTLMPNKPLRQIMAATRNFRDLGGWACDGGYIKYGILYRAGELNGNDADIVLNQLGIKTELDLTGDGTHGAISGLKYAGYVGGYAMYALTPVDAWKVNIRAVFDAAKYNEPLVFHCSAGADRTGTLACVIEGMLGVSQSNLDVDYELTSFYQYYERKRNEDYQGGGGADWRRLINQIKAVSGTTFRDKCVNFVASLGFTAAEINAFRAAMIDGYDPDEDDVTPDIDTFTVTNNLSHATSDNSATSATEFQPYEANIVAADGYAIPTVQILMNGVDVTAQVWDGKQTNLYRSIQKTLTNCTMDNTKVSVIDGQGFAAEVTADAGYTFEGATVSITMDGVDITNQVWMTKEDI